MIEECEKIDRVKYVRILNEQAKDCHKFKICLNV